LGASISNIVQLLSGNILKIMVISSIIGAPLCYFFAVSLMDSYFSTRTPMTLTPFLIAAFILISTSVLTVLSQILKAVRMNIVDRLREE
jgi:putative ABC transport system permease protein